MNTITLTFNLKSEPIEGRICPRCGKSDFREIETYPRQTGLASDHRYCSDKSDFSIPHIICLNCKKLVTLV